MTRIRPLDPELEEVLAEVRRIDVQTRRLVDDVMAGSYLSVFRGRGIEFDAVREYVEGDDPRSVDWNVTARMGRPFVKTYVDERELTVLFVLDTSPSMDAGFGIWSLRQVAARVVACLALSAVGNGDKVGLVAYDDRLERYVPPKKGRAHATRLVRDCLAVHGRERPTDLAAALDFARRAARRRHAVLFVLSDFLTDGWQRALTVCARRHDVVAVRLLPPELDLPSVGLLRVRDPESGGERLIDTGAARVRAAYAERVATWHARTERDLRRARVDRMDVPVPRTRDGRGVAGPILTFFRMREQRGRKR